MAERQNKFIVIEGIDGVGKSTIAAALVNELNKLSVPTILVKSPLGDYQLATSYINTNCDVNSHYLFYLSGIKHTSDLIRKMLKDYTVVCDRYIYSTEAYHRANNLSVFVDLKTLNILEPDYKFYISVFDEEIRQRRISARGKTDPGDNEIKQSGSLIERIESEFEKFELTVIDNTNRSIEDVVKEIRDKIR